MAKFESINLSSSLSGDHVLLKLTADIKFQSHELNTRWFLDIRFKERDFWSPDDLILSTSRTFTADKGHKTVIRSFAIPKEQVDTEPGKERVYALVDVVPLEEPPRFTRDRARTNETIVRV